MSYRDCPHTAGIICAGRGCERCGWNPSEDQRRKEMIADGKMEKTLFGKTKLYIKKKSRPSGANAEGGMENNLPTI